jgi:hypothetical protein
VKNKQKKKKKKKKKKGAPLKYPIAHNQAYRLFIW